MAPSSLRTSQSHPEITLPRRPPSLRPDSPVSLYSDAYSFYQLDSTSPSPNGSHFKFDSSGTSKSPQARTQNNNNTPPPPMVVVDPPEESKSKAEHYLQLGIKHHEANRLHESAMCFEKSAKEGGGCGVGMLMWGLTLRHGWGCKKDEKGGFMWVRKAAEGAVADLERARMSGGTGDFKERGVVKAELVLAIYEVGQCFFHGWGVAKDQKMGVSYYKVAARLGDADAQGDLGFCLVNGKGCKKDRKEAAKWYRAAVAQGYSDVGLAWIHKEKFQ
ncbi:HCP-like protein [Lentinula detonsa]|uniref:HCP-like protein n=1 Tax=Lentinula detonsa TaxID=2804962 RepID=A0A9W8PCF0_9AGAR|nr:HCP-like protein [Lentinula detonsa]